MTGVTGVAGLHHVQLAAPAGSEDALRSFYGDLLGIPEVAKPPALAAEWDDGFPGFRRCYVSDPVGNRIELLEPVGPS